MDEKTREALVYLRHLVARHPYVGFPGVEVINIEQIHQSTLLLDLNDGTTIRLDVSRAERG